MKKSEQTVWLEKARLHLPEVVGFIESLVRIPSVNGRDPESAVAQRIFQEAERLGLHAALTALEPTRPNVIVDWGTGKEGFVLVGHMDTVSEGDPASWKNAPFEAKTSDGIMYGRGTADNKAGIACGLYTIAILRELNLFDPARVRLMLAGVADEESGASSKMGMRYLLDKGLLQPARGAIYTYASDIVCIGHRGLLRFRLHAAGKAIHSGSLEWSQGREGVNAVTGLAELLLKLETLRFSTGKHPAFKGLNCRLTPGTVFNGGQFESMVPAAAEALVDVRLMPGQPAEEVIEAVQKEILKVERNRPGLKITFEIKNNLPAAAIPETHPLALSAQKWTRKITGKKWPIAGAGPANEGYMLIQAGIPTLCGFGPTGGNAHAPDEWINVESLVSTMAMYIGIITDILN